jgi:hypothetical protein
MYAKTVVAVVGLVATLQFTAWAQKKNVRSITASEDDRGQHPGTAAISKPSSIRCVSAVGNDPRQYPPSCTISAPGFYGVVNVGNTVGASGAGTVTLTCNGQRPMRCSAQITP